MLSATGKTLLLCGLMASLAAARAPAAPRQPRLLFTPADAPALRAEVQGGSDPGGAYARIRADWPFYQRASPEALLAELQGSAIVTELGLMAQLEPNGAEMAARARRLVLQLLVTRDVDTDDLASSLRLRTLAFGYDLAFTNVPDVLRAAVRDEIRSYLDFMQQHFNYRRYADRPYASNRGMTVGSSMGLAVLAIRDDVPPEQRPALDAALAFADRLVRACLQSILARDGVYREGVLYGAWAMRMALPYLEARRRLDGVDLDPDGRLLRMADWLAYEILPEGGGRTNNLNASTWAARPLALHATVLDWLQARHASRLARYLYRHAAGQHGRDPGRYGDRVATVLWSRSLPDVDPAAILPDGKLFADRGAYYYRSGWKLGAQGDEMLFSFHAGRFHGGHAQADQGQFTLYAHGDRLALDCGNAHPGYRPADTASHNLVLVDGRGQHNAGRSIGTDAHVAAALVSPFADYVRADLDSAYATHSPLNDPDVPSPGTDWSWGYGGGNPLRRATRAVAVVKGPHAPAYVLVADEFRKDDAPHAYDWLLHTDRGHAVVAGPPAVVPGGPAPGGEIAAAAGVTIRGREGQLDMRFAHPQREALHFEVAPYGHGGEDPPTLRLAARSVGVEGRFFVALLPLPGAATPPAHVAEPLGRATLLRIDWPGCTDVALFNAAESLVTAVVVTDARFAVVRQAQARVAGYLLAEGTRLAHAGLDLVTIAGQRASVALAGPTLHLSRADVGFRAFGPQVTRVVGPGGDLAFVRSGDYVHDARPAGRTASRVDAPVLAPAAVDYTLRAPGVVRITVHDVRGRIVRRLLTAALPAGAHRAAWDGRDDAGRRAAAGVYLVRVATPQETLSRKVLALR